MASGTVPKHVYSYDADGRRVRRSLNFNTEINWQVYGVGGELVAEYLLDGNGVLSLKKEYGYRNGQLLVIAEAAGGCQWLVTDGLGTPRLLVDQTGSLGGMKRHDYLPFGEELQAGMGHRQMSDGYGGGQGPRQQFVGYERDTETGLDFVQARYFGSTMGRFTSPDPVIVSVKRMINPQIWNGYSYVGNNPLNATDPTGEELVSHVTRSRFGIYA